ncbi:MAG: class I mannose-6-phosphate isomerase [Oscillospiraceae bacterium]|jgi:mannose-6-phosphate isomerase|nr:class I mannose-6-phosphate isomerase [Oscillospiraceae bacterium]
MVAEILSATAKNALWGIELWLTPPDSPFLVKLIDAKLPLSVQVHPDDEYAKSKGLPRGKSECWYITGCDSGAFVYLGLTRAYSLPEFRELLESGQAETALRRVSVKPGDFFYIPAGTLHALGGGIRLAEIQQPSDTTYRVFDWNRAGADGKPRELHIEDALACAALSESRFAEPLFTGGEFDFEFCGIRTRGLRLSGDLTVTPRGVCAHALVVSGRCEADGIPLAAGESALLRRGNTLCGTDAFVIITEF